MTLNHVLSLCPELNIAEWLDRQGGVPIRRLMPVQIRSLQLQLLVRFAIHQVLILNPKVQILYGTSWVCSKTVMQRAFNPSDAGSSPVMPIIMLW